MSTKRLSDIAVRIKEQRIKLGYSYNDLANLTGMSKSSLQRYETGGIANFPLDKLDVLSMALETTPDYLLGWGNDDIIAEDIVGEIKLLSSKLTKIQNKEFEYELYALIKEINLLIEAYSHIDNSFLPNCFNTKEKIKRYTTSLLKQSAMLHQNENRAITQIAKLCDIVFSGYNEKMESTIIDFEKADNNSD